MSAGKIPVTKEIEEHRKIWREMWLNMADGDPLRYNEIRRMDALKEFWIFFDFWKKRQEKKIENIRKQQQNENNKNRSNGR